MTPSLTKIKTLARLILILDLILVVAWLFLTWSTDQQIRLWRQLDNKSQALDNSDSLILKRYLDSTVDQRTNLEQLLIKGDAVTTFIDRLETLAHQSQVQLKITQATVANEGLNLHLVVNGSFAQVYRFLEILESLPEPVFISRADLTSSLLNAELAVKTGQNTWRMELDTTLLSYKN